MKRCLLITPFALLLSACAILANDTLAATPQKVLFIYDTLDKGSTFYIEAIRHQLTLEGFQVDEASSGNLKQKDISPYKQIVIYGMVMAFNWKSMVRNWLKAQKDLSNRKVYIFVTANRWFLKNLHKDLVKLAIKKHATVVDAISMATNKATEEEKKEKINTLLSQVEK